MPSPAPSMQIWPPQLVSHDDVAVFQRGAPMSRNGSPGKFPCTVEGELPTPCVPKDDAFMYTNPRMRKLPPMQADLNASAPDNAAVLAAPVSACGFVLFNESKK